MKGSTGRFERHLAALPCFAGLKHRDLALVAGLVDEVDVLAGRFFGGRPDQEVMIVADGAAIETGVAPALLGPGAVVGPSGATAMNRVRLLVIGRRVLPTLLERAPRLASLLRENHAFVGPPTQAHRTTVGPLPRPRSRIARHAATQERS